MLRPKLAAVFLRWARIAADVQHARRVEHCRDRLQRLRNSHTKQAAVYSQAAEAKVKRQQHCSQLKVLLAWRTLRARSSSQMLSVSQAVTRLLDRGAHRDHSYWLRAWHYAAQETRRAHAELVVQRQSSQQAVLCHVSSRSALLAQRALLAWRATRWASTRDISSKSGVKGKTQEDFLSIMVFTAWQWAVHLQQEKETLAAAGLQARRRQAAEAAQQFERQNLLVNRLCFLAWVSELTSRRLAQSSSERDEMLELVESSNTWILQLQRERRDYEEQLLPALQQVHDLQEALAFEVGAKEDLIFQIQHLQEQLKVVEANLGERRDREGRGGLANVFFAESFVGMGGLLVAIPQVHSLAEGPQIDRFGGPQASGAAAEGLPIWELVWEDHFDSETCIPDSHGVLRPSPENWSPEIGYKRGKELQWYQPQNAECKDGELVITAKRERQSWEKPEGSQCRVVNWDNREQPLDNQTCAVCAPPYFQYYNPCDLLRKDETGAPACDCSHTAEFTSASLMTRGKKEFSYGLFELRAKIDTRPGAWSSWWAIGNFDYVPWPKNGEIDIMDAFQRMVKASVIHAGESGLPSSAIQHAGARMVDREWEKYYHTWQLEWDKDFMEIRVDGEAILKVDLSVADPQRTSWPNPFTQGKKFFMILNLAVGGHSGGDPALTQFPSQFHVDYIRVFQKKGSTER
ncbi:unnamed protein product [Effrenium voratum]|nr:unnamed protein product [Effrenium voratum]